MNNIYSSFQIYWVDLLYSLLFTNQDFPILGSQTTREAVAMAVGLRLKAGSSQSVRDAKVEEALRVTKMYNSADTKVGQIPDNHSVSLDNVINLQFTI